MDNGRRLNMWRIVLGYEMYEVSDMGEIRRRQPASIRHPVTGRILRTSIDKATGYGKIGLHDGLGRQATKAIHVLVCEAFNGPRPGGMDVRHLDGNKTNNRADNLAYGTRTQNNLDAVSHGTNYNTSKTSCIRGHPLKPPNLYGTYGRKCRACGRARSLVARLRARGIDVDLVAVSNVEFQRVWR